MNNPTKTTNLLNWLVENAPKNIDWLKDVESIVVVSAAVPSPGTTDTLGSSCVRYFISFKKEIENGALDSNHNDVTGIMLPPPLVYSIPFPSDINFDRFEVSRQEFLEAVALDSIKRFGSTVCGPSEVEFCDTRQKTLRWLKGHATVKSDEPDVKIFCTSQTDELPLMIIPKKDIIIRHIEGFTSSEVLGGFLTVLIPELGYDRIRIISERLISAGWRFDEGSSYVK